jgi:hypothetical protein
MKLTDDELKKIAEIRHRLTTVPPAPWRSIWDDPDGEEKMLDEYEQTTVYSTDESIPEGDRFVFGLTWYDRLHSACRKEEAHFIAESRSDIPWLLDLVERLGNE